VEEEGGRSAGLRARGVGALLGARARRVQVP
jgi:hypothetical protein